MSRIFITGSADGLGQIAANILINQGHQVVLHARNAERAQQTKDKVGGAEQVLIGDVSSIEETKKLAAEVNSLGRFNAIIHNAGVYSISDSNLTIDGLPKMFAVNSLAPYILTCLIQKPERLIYMSSGMHLQGNLNLKGLSKESFRSGNTPTYSDTKLHNLILSMAVARKWPDVFANAVNPGWVPTKMGGAGAPDSLQEGAETQAWLAVSNDEKAKVSGQYFHHKKENQFLVVADSINVQEKYLSLCEEISGVSFPNH